MGNKFWRIAKVIKGRSVASTKMVAISSAPFAAFRETLSILRHVFSSYTFDLACTTLDNSSQITTEQCNISLFCLYIILKFLNSW